MQQTYFLMCSGDGPEYCGFNFTFTIAQKVWFYCQLLYYCTSSLILVDYEKIHPLEICGP